ncbi:MAG: toxin-antitoxin system [Pseudomonadota bacterium]
MAQSTMGVRLEKRTQDRLKKLSEQRDRSPHYLMKEAIEAYLQREEALEAEKSLVRRRWQRFELTDETVSQNDMAEWAASLVADA